MTSSTWLKALSTTLSFRTPSPNESWIGSVLGENHINIANFSLGRQDAAPQPPHVREALAIVETDGLVPEAVLRQLLENKAVKIARVVEFKS